MKSQEDEAADQTDDQPWPSGDDDADTPVPNEVLVNADERVPDEAGYGYGV
jgi:hypothetical protein